MAAIIAWLRIAYDARETSWQRVILEATLCGAISYGISSGLSYFQGLPPGVSVFAGATVGFMGVDFLRAQAKRFVRGKVDARSRKNPKS